MRVIALASFAGYLALTGWRIVFQGLMEQPSFEVSHLEAGAGDPGLVFQGFLALVSIGCLIGWLMFGTQWKEKMLAVVAGIVVVGSFALCQRC